MIKDLVFSIIAIILYFIAPDHYSWPFCTLCMVVFLVDAFLCILPELKRKEYFSFNIVFFFAYFWTSFAYPVIVYGTYIDRWNKIFNAIDWDLLSHTSALALVFITMYILGYNQISKQHGVSIVRHYYKAPIILYIIVSFAFIGLSIYSFTSSGSTNLTLGKFTIHIYFLFFALTLYCKTISSKKEHTPFNFFLENKVAIITGLVVIFVFLIYGDRGPAIRTVLVLAAVYYFFWNKIKVSRILLYGTVSLLMIFFVKMTRNGAENLANGNVSSETIKNAFELENGPIYLFADLFHINEELCLGYEYYQKRGLFHPERILLAPLAPFPFLPSLVSSALFGMTESEMETGQELNRVVLNAYNLNGAFGNHPASDLLMSFGLVGVIILSYLFGKIVSFIMNKKEKNIYYGVCAIILMSLAIYLPRCHVFYMLRPLGFVILFVYFMYQLPRKFVKHHI